MKRRVIIEISFESLERLLGLPLGSVEWVMTDPSRMQMSMLVGGIGYPMTEGHHLTCHNVNAYWQNQENESSISATQLQELVRISDCIERKIPREEDVGTTDVAEFSGTPQPHG